MKRLLLVTLLILTGCSDHQDTTPVLDPKAALIARLGKTATDTSRSSKERQKAIQQLRKIGANQWGPLRPPSGRFYLLEK